MGKCQSTPVVDNNGVSQNGTSSSSKSLSGNGGPSSMSATMKASNGTSAGKNNNKTSTGEDGANGISSSTESTTTTTTNVLFEVLSGDPTREAMLQEQHDKMRSDKALAALGGNNSPTSLRNIHQHQQKESSIKDLMTLAAAATSPPKATTSSSEAVATAGREIYEDEEGIDMFFDAMQSFSDVVGSMAYAPTSTMRNRASLDTPQTLLSKRNLTNGGVESIEEEGEEEETEGTTTGRRASAIAVRQKLQKHTTGTQGDGYPGGLTQEELDACLDFRDELKKRDPAYREMVHAYSPYEEEAFALCRFLRARQFVYEDVFEMLDGNEVVETWNKARKNNFWEDIEKVYGCPVTVLQSIFPLLVSGLGKNGAVVLYFKAGDIDVDGIECLADLPDLVPFVWHALHFKATLAMKREIERHDPKKTTVLAEKIVVVDLKGLPSALFGSDGIDFLKKAAKSTCCFPEILNRMYMLNVPTTFSIIWAVLKVFMEPRTIRKVGFFSRLKKAKEDMLQFIDSDELISDYGGNGSSFDDLLLSRQQELNPGFDHHIVEHVCVQKKDMNIPFSLKKGEKVHSIVVYTKADKGATFTVLQGSKTLGSPTTVQRRKDQKKHYKIELPVSDVPSGPGTFVVSAKGESKEKQHFLVSINIGR